MANLTDTATWVDPVVGIDNGDNLDSTELNMAADDLTQRTQYLRTHSPYAGTLTDRIIPLTSGVSSNGIGGAGYWVYFANSSGVPFWLQGSIAGDYGVCVDLPVSPLCTVTSIKATVRGTTASAHSGLPATMPILRFMSLDPTTDSAPTVHGSVTDTSGSVGVYDAVHTLEISTSVLMSASRRYYVLLSGETGANSQTTLNLLGLKFSTTPPANV